MMGKPVKIISVFCLLLCLVFVVHPARAMTIEEVTSPGGIKAWLVRDKTVPLIAMNFAFQGGSAEEDPARAGVSSFLSALMDEGAGKMTALEFQNTLKENAIRLSFSAGRDRVSGSLQTLSKNKKKAFELLSLALLKPRFDKDAVERIRGQLITSLQFESQNPSKTASKKWMQTAFGTHPYGRSVSGSIDTVKKIKRAHLVARAKNIFVKNRLLISVVGDIEKEELGVMLDQTFGGLAKKKAPRLVKNITLDEKGNVDVIKLKIPQSVVQFGLNGIPREDTDFIPAYVMNYILGGGGFSSRLTQEVREKRGLTYSIYSYLLPFKNASLFIGGASTKNENVHETIKIIRQELKRLAIKGVTKEELTNAKTYLTGSYALRFDTSSKIAGQLLGMQWAKLGIDYPDKRNALINAVTLEDIQRVAKRILKTDQLKFTIIGQPVEDLGASSK